MLDLRANHIGIGDDPEQVVFLVYYGKLLDATPEDHPCGICDIHIWICDYKLAGHGLLDGLARLYEKKVPGCDIPHYFITFNDREPVMFGLLDLLYYRLYRTMEIHADDIIGHIILDLFFVHQYSFRCG